MYLPIITEFNISCSGVICHCIMMCSFFVELLPSSFLPLLQTNHVDLYMRVFWAIPWSREINIIHQHPLPLVSVCRNRPSAWRANPSDGESLNTRNNWKNWHPMWGLWLVAETQSTSASSRSAAWWLTTKSYKNRFISAKEHQWTYDFARVADRPTQQCALPSQALQ